MQKMKNKDNPIEKTAKREMGYLFLIGDEVEIQVQVLEASTSITLAFTLILNHLGCPWSQTTRWSSWSLCVCLSLPLFGLVVSKISFNQLILFELGLVWLMGCNHFVKRLKPNKKILDILFSGGRNSW